jgi:hypothetical protein
VIVPAEVVVDITEVGTFLPIVVALAVTVTPAHVIEVALDI